MSKGVTWFDLSFNEILRLLHREKGVGNKDESKETNVEAIRVVHARGDSGLE